MAPVRGQRKLPVAAGRERDSGSPDPPYETCGSAADESEVGNVSTTTEPGGDDWPTCPR